MSDVERFDSYFSEKREFSLGRRMPNEGGAAEWVKLVDGEPMPVRYGLESICEHPALASKKIHLCEVCSNILHGAPGQDAGGCQLRQATGAGMPLGSRLHATPLLLG